MRNVSIFSGAVLVFALAGVTSAQQTPGVQPATQPATQPGGPETPASLKPGQEILLNFGYRGNSTSGDVARWERYRDLSSGFVGSAIMSSESPTLGLKFNATNVGYKDQKYTADYNRFGKLKLSGMWNSIPLNYGYNTLTPWKDAGGNVWTLDPAARLAVQNKTALGIGTTAADYNTASIYRSLATPFTLQSRRDILNLGMKYRMSDAVGVNVGFTSTKRGGTQPFGGSFAFNNGNEHPVTLDDRTNDMTAALEWARPNRGMLRVQWTGSFFKNQFQALTWDNPLRATDYNNGRTPPSGPYDASGYSNGNGPAFGRLALPPSNSMNSFSVVGLRKLPARSTLNGQVSFTTMKQNEKLIPWTTNSMIAQPSVYAIFPGLAQLPRQTAEAEVRAVNAMLSFTSHPLQKLTVDARYRYNDHDNRTPAFDASNNVRFDAVPEAVPGTESEGYSIKQNLLEAGAAYDLPHNSSLRIGYIFDDVERTHRVFEGTTDHTFRVSLDTWGNQYVMLRGVFENTSRTGKGFEEEALDESGSQPALRFYDEADMTRNKGTLVLQVNPTDKFDVGFSLAKGTDEFNGAEHEFGLLDNSNSSYNVNVTVYPLSKVTVSGNYGYEKFSTLQASRNSNPPPTDPTAYNSFTDPNRNWDLDNGETVKNFGLSLDLIKALPRTDIRLNFDQSQSDNAFKYSGPRIVELTTNIALTPNDGPAPPCGNGTLPNTSCFQQLPNVTNKWQQFRIDLTHMFNVKYGFNAGYSYEKLNIVDYSTRDLADGTPRIDPLGAITTGYGNRPYKGQTFMVRFIYVLQSTPIL